MYKIKQIIQVFLITIFLYNCTSNTIYAKPDNLIPRKEMIKIMTDLYLANAATNVTNKYNQRQVNYASLVFEKYGVDTTQFKNSNLYYMSRIDDYEKMHKKVQENIQKMKKKVDLELKEKDSLQRIQHQ